MAGTIIRCLALSLLLIVVTGEDSKCEKERTAAQENPTPGGTIPHCEPDGTYTPKRCEGSKCFCVDPATGEKVAGTEVSVGNEPPCGAGAGAGGAQTGGLDGYADCHEHKNKTEAKPGAFIPKCKADGTYQQMQCHGSTGYCWCADENGKEIEDSKLRFKQPDCSPPAPGAAPGAKPQEYEDCTEHKKMTEDVVGGYVPVCEDDGTYTEKQCHGGTGYCWCVESENGEMIEDTKVRFAQPDCSSDTPGGAKYEAFEDCKEEKEKTKVTPGAFVPECEEDGTYKEKQCHGSTGYCWCVESEKGQEVEDTMVKSDDVECAGTRAEGVFLLVLSLLVFRFWIL